MHILLYILLMAAVPAAAQTEVLGVLTAQALPATVRGRIQPTGGTAVLVPAGGTWDGLQNLEPTLFWDSSASHMKVYLTGDSIPFNRIGMATSTNLSTFTKAAYNPVIGGGRGGAPANRRAHSSWVGKTGGTYYCYATNGYGVGYSGEDRNVYAYTSTDGVNWSDEGLKLNKSNVLGAAVAGFGNISIVCTSTGTPVQVGGVYTMLAEAYTGSRWEIYRATATSLLGPWTWTHKLTSMEVVSGGMYGGAWTVYSGGTFHAFYHYANLPGNLPTSIAYAQSTDGISWTVKESGIIHYYDATPYGAYNPVNGAGTDQVADIALTEYGGKVYIMAEFVTNDAPNYQTLRAQIHLWTFDGTFAQFVSGL